MTRRVALVSGHFPPSNLVGAQRARLWSRYLPEFGWEPIIVTGDPLKYEERPDPDLERLVTPGLRVVHAATWPTRPVRLVGDIGVRSFCGCYRALARLAIGGTLALGGLVLLTNVLGTGAGIGLYDVAAIASACSGRHTRMYWVGVGSQSMSAPGSVIAVAMLIVA